MMRHPLKSTLFIGVLAFGATLSMHSAGAGDGVYCDRDDDRCYRSERRYDGDYSRYDNYRSYDRGYDRNGYRDRNWSDRRWRYACDSDGDRCYASESGYWNYREYYRRHGYRWHN